jgi:tRNA(fMet)-specific endonuclease VapC
VRYLLDTNVVIQLWTGAAGLQRRVRQHSLADIGVSSVASFVLSFGALKSARAAHNLARVEALAFESLPFDVDDARGAAEVRLALARAGMPIGPYDVLIAGQALARDLTLVTHSTREFARVPGLRVEDWEA